MVRLPYGDKKQEEEHYADGTYDYMNDDCFKIKWSVIAYLMEQYGDEELRILDLACGRSEILNFIFNVDKYVGVDLVSNVDSEKMSIAVELYLITRYRYLVADIYKLDLSKFKNEKFNCLLWVGIGDHPDKYPEVLKKYLPVLDQGGLIVLDYMKGEPIEAIERIGDTKITHVMGCKLELPYILEKKMERWPGVGNRVIEVFRKQ